MRIYIHIQRLVALTLVIILLLSVVFIHTSSTYAAPSYTWEGLDFAEGTLASTTASSAGLSLALDMDDAIIDDTYNDFIAGTTYRPSSAIRNSSGDGQVGLTTGAYGYDVSTYPAVGLYPLRSNYDADSGILRVSSWGEGLHVIHTQGTALPYDDVLEVYDFDMVPHRQESSLYNPESGVLYAGGFQGQLLTVVDTKLTDTIADDEVLGTYTVPTARHMFYDYDTDMLYVSGSNKLAIIDTKGTLTLDDDDQFDLDSGSTPALPHDAVRWSQLDTVSGFLYVGTEGGVAVINTQGTKAFDDDETVATYTSMTSPALPANKILHVYYDTATELLYVTTIEGVVAIATDGTATMDDDTIVASWSNDNFPTIHPTIVNHLFIDAENNHLYISSGDPAIDPEHLGGLTVIDTQGTITSDDDTIYTTYSADSEPALPGDSASLETYIDATTGLLYVTTGRGVLVTDLDVSSRDTSQYHSETTYYSSIREIVGTPKSIVLNTTQDSDHEVGVAYRTGEGDIFVNDFDDGLTTEYLADSYGSYSYFETAVESDGIITFSDPADIDDYLDTWIDTGYEDDYFPAGSTITIRTRMNNTHPESIGNMDLYLSVDNEEDYATLNATLFNNEWITYTFTPSVAFSKMSLELYYEEWDPSDSLEIDWIRVTSPVEWSEWSSWCDDPVCPIDADDLVDAQLMQYRLHLHTEDPDTTPLVDSVSITQGYFETGTFTSENIVLEDATVLSFFADYEIWASTTIAYEYSTDGGSIWTSMTNTQMFPAGFAPALFMWRATLTSDNASITPRIVSAVLSTESDDEEEPNEPNRPTSRSSSSTRIDPNRQSPVLSAEEERLHLIIALLTQVLEKWLLIKQAGG